MRAPVPATLWRTFVTDTAERADMEKAEAATQGKLIQVPTLGEILADNGVGLVYGGGSTGLMGAIATAVPSTVATSVLIVEINRLVPTDAQTSALEQTSNHLLKVKPCQMVLVRP